MHSIFVSDLHLTPDRPPATEVFLDFLARVAGQAQALYILGDLFEYWVGDDDLDDDYNSSIADALRAASRKGVKLYFMRGNRDVLAGEAFATRCGATLLADPLLVDLHGTRTLLMHGDTLCTDDVEYQNFRAYARDAGNQGRFLAQSLQERKKQMIGMRAQSEQSKQAKTAEIMDVNALAVQQAFRAAGVDRLIHGHTHRPGRHVHRVDGRERERWVLGDWYARGSYLRCDAAGCTAIAL